VSQPVVPGTTESEESANPVIQSRADGEGSQDAEVEILRSHPLHRLAQNDAVRRIRRIALAAYFVFAIYVILTRDWRAFLGLTCSALVAMIGFLWLEETVEVFLQPASNLHARRLTWRTLARFALLGAAVPVTLFVARFNALSVLLGFSIVVVGIIGEAVYELFTSGDVNT
jgi:hypothetical protein